MAKGWDSGLSKLKQQRYKFGGCMSFKTVTPELSGCNQEQNLLEEPCVRVHLHQFPEFLKRKTKVF